MPSETHTSSPYEVILEWNERKPQIVCNNCANQPVWCEHIKFALGHRRELSIIWPPDYVQPMSFLLPMFPNSNQYTNISLEPDGDGVKRIFWPDAPELQPLASPNMLPLKSHNPLPLIGNIQRGEGLMTVRSLMVEYMVLQFAINGIVKPECSAAHHGVNAQAEWDLRLQSDTFRPPNLWSVYTTGACLYCATHNPSNDTSDLVPASESGWNRNK